MLLSHGTGGTSAGGWTVAALLGAPTDLASLIGVRHPVLLRWGDGDDICPPPVDAHRYRDGLPDPGRVRGRVGAQARDFLVAALLRR